MGYLSLFVKGGPEEEVVCLFCRCICDAEVAVEAKFMVAGNGVGGWMLAHLRFDPCV